MIQDSYPRKEIIIVVDGSPDDTGAVADDIAARYPDLVRVLHQEKAGGNVARNRGMRESTGEFLQFLDADDYLLDNKLAISMAAFEANEQLLMVYTDAWIDDPSRGREPSQFSHENIRTMANRAPLNLICWLQTNSPIWRRSHLEKHGLIWDESLRCCQEADFHLRAIFALGSASLLHHIKSPHFVWNLGSNTITSEMRTAWYLDQNSRALDLMLRHLTERGIERKRLVGSYIRMKWLIFQRAALAGHGKIGREVASDIRRDSPILLERLVACLPFPAVALAAQTASRFRGIGFVRHVVKRNLNRELD